MLNQFQGNLPRRETFICRIIGDPFVTINPKGVTICSFPVKVRDSHGVDRQRVIIMGRVAERCLPIFKTGVSIQVSGVRKIRPFGYGQEVEVWLEEIVAWTAKLYDVKQGKLTLLKGGTDD